eukprot:NODE_4912_length_1001_cov_131.351936_g4705_i0.p1 GENE.NODE_4912_length_1001_cov_131.351936_g4705_i0~~NODE_4912_length_1001_cov_131.351936_g4705_i0.p1  ORF type:complete len:333 (+),score=89.62 NODE_4912_length_1001_cov_131.351936_g4705_i0:52-999(+)
MTSLVWLALLVGVVVGDPLLLSPLIAKGMIAQARNYSTIDGGLGHSGFLTVPSASGKQNNNMFFWYQPCSKGCNPSTAPFILWLQGGPGGPGTFGALSELGNWYLDSNLQLHERCFSWCEHYNCLFVDQPVMTGFSYATVPATGKPPKPKDVEYTKTSGDALEQVYQMLMQFYKVWPETKGSPFYITGESYGGLYTAHMGYAIMTHNQKNPETHINLVGLAVGDPIINSQYQNDSNVAGYAKCFNVEGKGNRFCYTVVRNAGHESPAFQPRANYDMIMRFIQKRSFEASGEGAVPKCGQCGGVPPFAGPALPECH